MVNIASNYINGGMEGQRWGSAHASIVPYESFKTKDGYLTIGNDGYTIATQFLKKLSHFFEIYV